MSQPASGSIVLDQGFFYEHKDLDYFETRDIVNPGGDFRGSVAAGVYRTQDPIFPQGFTTWGVHGIEVTFREQDQSPIYWVVATPETVKRGIQIEEGMILISAEVQSFTFETAYYVGRVDLAASYLEPKTYFKSLLVRVVIRVR